MRSVEKSSPVGKLLALGVLLVAVALVTLQVVESPARLPAFRVLTHFWAACEVAINP